MYYFYKKNLLTYLKEHAVQCSPNRNTTKGKLSHLSRFKSGDIQYFSSCHQIQRAEPKKNQWMNKYRVYQILTRAPNMDSSAAENSPQKMHYFLLFVW